MAGIMQPLDITISQSHRTGLVPMVRLMKRLLLALGQGGTGTVVVRAAILGMSASRDWEDLENLETDRTALLPKGGLLAVAE